MKIKQVEISKQLKRNRETHRFLIDMANFAYVHHTDKDLSENKVRDALFKLQCSLEHHADQMERSYLSVNKDINQ